MRKPSPLLSVFVAAYYIAGPYVTVPAADLDAPPLASMQVSGTVGTGSIGSQVSRLGAVEVHNAITDEAYTVVRPTSATPLILSLPPHLTLPRGPPLAGERPCVRVTLNLDGASRFAPRARERPAPYNAPRTSAVRPKLRPNGPALPHTGPATQLSAGAHLGA